MWIVSIGGAVTIAVLIFADSVARVLLGNSDGEFPDAFFAALVGGEFFDAFVPFLLFTVFFSVCWFLGSWIVYFLVSWIARRIRKHV